MKRSARGLLLGLGLVAMVIVPIWFLHTPAETPVDGFERVDGLLTDARDALNAGRASEAEAAAEAVLEAQPRNKDAKALLEEAKRRE